MVALAVSGAADMVSIVVRQTLVQLETPDEMRGRVSAVNATFISASNQLGEFRAGATAPWLGPWARWSWAERALFSWWRCGSGSSRNLPAATAGPWTRWLDVARSPS
jgi:hypothetical protein